MKTYNEGFIGMERKRIFITVKTYPTTVEEPSKTKSTPWEWRKQIIFKSKKIYTNLSKAINLAKTTTMSLAIFKPKQIIDFIIEKTDREWDKEKLDALKANAQQLDFFKTAEEITEEFKLVKKLPYKFSYHFCDDSGKESTLMIEDWEIGMLYFNCLKQSNGDETRAIELVKQKYFDKFKTKDLYFFLGTTKANHFRSLNPFIIIGIFCPPKTNQFDLFECAL
jgi:hypothetical protein